MELRHIRYFVAVAEEGRIAWAAERLGMQQPPLSQQIKAMERELGVQLFHRKARGVELTDAGRSLLDDARVVLAHLDRAFDTTRRIARGEQGRIRVGATPSCPFHPLVPHIIREFRQSHPLVSLQLEEHHNQPLLEQLRNGQIDAAFIRQAPPDPKEFAVSRLLEEPMLMALPSGHAFVRSGGHDDALFLKDLADETFILYLPDTNFYKTTMMACREAGFNPRVGQEVPRISSMINLVAAGFGVALVPASLQQMHMDGVAYRHLKGPVQPKAGLRLALRHDSVSAAVRKFLNLVRRAAKDFQSEKCHGTTTTFAGAHSPMRRR
jgi:DNA-binding transcriptional LysR family regulator